MGSSKHLESACIWFRTRGRASEKVTEYLIACGTAATAQDDPWLCIVKTDHQVYKAAMDQNWEAMGALGRQAGKPRYSGAKADAAMSIEVPYDGKDIYEQKSGLKISASMVRETGTKVFRIRVQAERFDHGDGCDSCCIFCFDPRAMNCSNGDCVIL